MMGFFLVILVFTVIGASYCVIAGGTADENDDAEQIAYLREYNRRKADRKNKKS